MIASSELSAISIGLAASALTYLGGRIAFLLQGRLPQILGVAAGIVVGVALFDLVPEALDLGAATTDRKPCSQRSPLV